jgi:hypothetical protein
MLIYTYLTTVDTSSQGELRNMQAQFSLNPLSNANKERIFKGYNRSASVTVPINDKIYA